MVVIIITVKSLDEAASVLLKKAYSDDLGMRETFAARVNRITYRKKVISAVHPYVVDVHIWHKNTAVDKKSVTDRFLDATRLELAKRGVFPEQYVCEVKVL